MKIGFRKFSFKKRVTARTTAKIKRKIKRTFIPFYGKKGIGWIKNPKRALYNKVYNKVTISPFDVVMKAKPTQEENIKNIKNNLQKVKDIPTWRKVAAAILWPLVIILLIIIF